MTTLPTGLSETRRAVVESALAALAPRFDPDQVRRHARRALQEIEPDPHGVDAHENQLVGTEEGAAGDRAH